MLAYYNGEFLPKSEIRVSPDDRGFLFGDGVYEVLHIYNGKPFRPDLHLARLRRSLEALHLTGVDVDGIPAIIETLIERSGLLGQEASAYLQVTRGAAPQRRHTFPEAAVPPTLYAVVTPHVPAPERYERGIRVILIPDIRWLRCDIKAISLVANVCASQQALERGAQEAIFVRDGVVTEGSHTSIAAVIGGCLVTHPLNHLILDGATRRVTLELCRDLGIPVEERSMSQAELCAADEVLLMATTSEIQAVVAIDDLPVKSGWPGPVTCRLRDAFRDLTRRP